MDDYEYYGMYDEYRRPVSMMDYMPTLKPEKDQLFLLHRVVPYDYPDDLMRNTRDQMIRDFWREVGKKAQPNQNYFLRFEPPEYMPNYLNGSDTVRLTLRATLIPVYDVHNTAYTRLDRTPTAKTSFEAAADGIADYILRRILD
jgi:hypothetical protein